MQKRVGPEAEITLNVSIRVCLNEVCHAGTVAQVHVHTVNWIAIVCFYMYDALLYNLLVRVS